MARLCQFDLSLLPCAWDEVDLDKFSECVTRLDALRPKLLAATLERIKSQNSVSSDGSDGEPSAAGSDGETASDGYA
jgi:hypothetical protein